jgi:hypothetical protein
MKRHRLYDTVALVEHAKNRDSLRHGRDSGRILGRRSRLLGRLLLGLLAFAPAPGERQCRYAEQ